MKLYILTYCDRSGIPDQRLFPRCAIPPIRGRGFEGEIAKVTQVKVTKIPSSPSPGVHPHHKFCLSHNCSRNTVPQVLSFPFFFVRSWRTPIHFILLFFVGPRPQQTHNSINKYEHCPRTHRPIGHGFPSS